MTQENFTPTNIPHLYSSHTLTHTLPHTKQVFAAAFDWVQIGQSSPWVCDDANVVTVEMRSNQPLLHACHATISAEMRTVGEVATHELGFFKTNENQ